MHREHNESFHMYIRGIILIGFTMLLFKLLVTGNIQNFIAPRMIHFVYITLFICLLLGIVQIWRSGTKTTASCSCGEEHEIPNTTGSLLLYSLFIIPIVTGFLFSDSIIDGSVAAKRGINFGRQQDLNGQLLTDGEENPNQLVQEPPKGYFEKLERELQSLNTIVVDDERYISIMDVIGKDVTGFKGKAITLTGFIHREENMEKDTAVIARFGITCCVADASVFGMLATGKDVASLTDDTWVRVTGTLDETMYIDALFPIVKVTNIEKIPEPKMPYVYQNFQN
jgi:uncharacterized repeat protein (TIGR03943 family)